MPILRFTMVAWDTNKRCTFTASVSPGYLEDVLETVLAVLRSFYRRMDAFPSEEQNLKCPSYEFDDPVARSAINREYFEPLPRDDLHVALVDGLESIGWEWVGPNEIHEIPKPNQTAISTTWTFVISS
ncbi:unnamed protein product [Clavelina lepadiformis]|uniref:Uncharacterized protein n=1 Tax=Clavelina lepadiformis TaxID=159417 RepID=A0ABP0FX30_CLALP